MGQGKLYRVYDELLRERGVTSAQVLLTFFDISARTHYLNARRTLRRLLDWRVVPVINENDTTSTDEISFGDNDFLAAQVAILIGADLLVLLTDADGLFTADPRTDPAARLVAEVDDPAELDATRDRPRDLAARLGRHALEGRGGGDGHRRRDPRGHLQRAATRPRWRAVVGGGRAGTRFAAQEARYSSFKLWLRYAKPARGTVVDRRGRRARPARGRHVAAPRRRGRASRATSTPATRVHVAEGDVPSSARASPTTRPPSCAAWRG